MDKVLTCQSKVLKLLLVGMLAALFYSSTNVINRLISIDGGHWLWTASMRYAFMIVLLFAIITFWYGKSAMSEVLSIFKQHWKFWVIAGGIGHGLFYAAYCIGFVYTHGWVVITIFNLNLIFTPIILLVFGKKVPIKGVLLLALIFIGVFLINIEQYQQIGMKDLLYGVVPAFFSAFFFPLGNQLLGEAQSGGNSKWKIPNITNPMIQKPLVRVMLMAMGSVPFWLVLILSVGLTAQPTFPTVDQVSKILVVALLSGIAATSIFYYARHQLAVTPYEIALTESTLASEIIFTLIGEVVFVGIIASPGPLGFAGIMLVVIGFILLGIKRNAVKT